MKLGFCLSTILVAGTLTVSGSFAEEAVPAAKETTTANPSTNTGGQGSLHGTALEGNAGSKGTADNAGAKGKAGGTTGDVRGKAGAGSIGSAKESGSATNPIDTRITVQPGRAIKKALLGNEKKTSNPAAPPSVNSARQTIPHDMSGSARNAVGVPLDHASVKGASPGPQVPGPAAPDGAAKNAIGALGSNNGSAGGANIVHPISGPAIAGYTPHNRAVINGTGVGRPGSGPSTLGGAARNAAAINGTSIRPKQ